MTIREMSAFDDMFSRIFNAANSHTTPSGDLFQTPTLNRGARTAFDLQGIGKTDAKNGSIVDAGDLFSQIRKHSKKTQWTSAADEEFDRKREEMSLCETDIQLLEWAQREVFDESKRYEEAARRQVAEGKTSADQSLHLQPLSYPYLIALLMRTFRDKYASPHIALSVFSHARHLSIPSFVFGCTTSAYNELLETRWRCFRDLRGVCDALEEMQVNGVPMDGRTMAMCELVRRECGERELWSEERNVGSGEVWEMVQSIDKVIAEMNRTLGHGGRKVVAGAAAERKLQDEENELGAWKRRAFDTESKKKKEDHWEFGNWDVGRGKSSSFRDHLEEESLSPVYA